MSVHHPSTAINPSVTAGRLSIYILLFWLLMGGIHTPFWQTWLMAHDLSTIQIGLILGIAPLSRPITAVLIAWVADQQGSRKWLLSLLSFAAAGVFYLFRLTDNFTLWLLITFVWAQLIWTASSLLTSMTTLATQYQTKNTYIWVDGLIYAILIGLAVVILTYFYRNNMYHSWLDLVIIGAVTACGLATLLGLFFNKKLDYGRLRLWGTVGSISGITYMSNILFNPEKDGYAIMFQSLFYGMIALGVIALFLPDIRSPKVQHTKLPAWHLLQQRPIAFLLIAAMFLQASHAMLYAQGSIYWQSKGIDFGTIGKFWSFGNLAELVFFTFGWMLHRHIRPSYILILAGLVACIRWGLMAMLGDQITFVYFIMLLHGFTYSLGHLGAMYWVEKHIPAHYTASMQSLYTSLVFGVGLGLNMMLAGWYTQRFSAETSWMIMSAMGVITMVAAIGLLYSPKNWTLHATE